MPSCTLLTLRELEERRIVRAPCCGPPLEGPQNLPEFRSAEAVALANAMGPMADGFRESHDAGGPRESHEAGVHTRRAP